MQEFTFIIKNDIECISNYIANLSDSNTFIYQSFTKFPNNSEILELNIPYGKTDILYDGIKIIANLIQDDKVVGLDKITAKHEELKLIIFHNSQIDAINLFKKLIISAREQYCNNESYIIIRNYVNNYRLPLIRLPKKNLEMIYLNSEIKKSIINDLDSFYKNDYIDKIPMVRKYLFHGPSGTGKTSLIYALAATYNKDIIIPMFDVDTNSFNVIKMLSTISDEILILENIDSIFDNNDNNLNINYLLNAIDLVCHKNRLVVFATTKNFEKVINNLTESNYFDMITKINYPDKEIIKEIYQDFFPNQDEYFEEIFGKFSKKKITVPFLINLFKNNRLANNNIKIFLNKIDQLIDIYSNKCNNQLYN